MTPLLEDFGLITANTLEHYNVRAAEFWEGTRDHDVKQNIEALLRHQGMASAEVAIGKD